MGEFNYCDGLDKTPQKTVKVLQLITLSETGGAQKVVYELVCGLINRRQRKPDSLPCVEFDVSLASRAEGALVEWIKNDCPEVPFYPLQHLQREIDPLKDGLALLELWRLIRRIRPHIVHCHSSKAGILGRLAAYLAGVPVILFTVHGWSFYGMAGFRRSLFRALEKWMTTITDAIVCVSEHDLKEGHSQQILTKASARVIHNGIPSEMEVGNFLPLRQDLLTNHQTAYTVVTVGRLAEQKDPWLFLDIAEKCAEKCLQKNDCKMRFFWVGQGPLEKEIQAEIKKRNLTEWVSLLGERQDIPAILRQADLFLLTSRWEGLPIVILEAMRAGVPVLSVDVGGIREMIQSETTGIIVDTREPDAISTALLNLLQDPEKRKRLGTSVRGRFLQQFTVDMMLREYKKLYLDRLADIGLLTTSQKKSYPVIE
ncbi:glycosyltransferase, group 1 family protein, putative [Heliomicrobium modesticaldum Ice1]|uniref:Glycosyltransferase, group 1 family protein, putative n=1 Tax=Heliobacterium modesticaldum (strain ATCC 51547 / Ice1) TaxID=498761 RepID=B0THJ8_HELMI|nr:glycosyltransferase family 4 protein [Heliomicrobium modesticaldum]ABZ83436.1 glycosyltransferase, group 1 family protein, putative [Heliomicrobium modesticaldum Ice1]